VVVEQQVAKKGYWLAFAGAIIGAFVVVTGFVSILSVMGLLGAFDQLDGMDLLGVALYGQFLAVPIGCAIGITTALAIGRREAPILTGVLSIPCTVVVFLAVWGLTRIVDTMDYGWLIIIPPLIIPFVARWAALWAKR